MERLRKRYWKLQLAKQKSRLSRINSKGNGLDDGERTPSIRESKFMWNLPKDVSPAKEETGAGTQVPDAKNSQRVLKLAIDPGIQTSTLWVWGTAVSNALKVAWSDDIKIFHN